jgi:hypothetical protein
VTGSTISLFADSPYAQSKSLCAFLVVGRPIWLILSPLVFPLIVSVSEMNLPAPPCLFSG